MPKTVTEFEHAAARALEAPSPGRRFRQHPQEQGAPSAPGPVPEIGEIVPNRHSASAEAALLRWRETHEQ